MKGIKIEVEYQKPIYLYRPADVVEAIAHAIYYTANPDTKMCIPNCAYEKAEKLFEEWKNETREKKVCNLYCYTDKTCSIQNIKCSNSYDETCIRFKG